MFYPLNYSELAPPERFELPTPWFEARHSSPLSYRGMLWSEWQDSNLRPPAPKAGRLARLTYTRFILVPCDSLELPTYCLRNSCSTR